LYASRTRGRAFRDRRPKPSCGASTAPTRCATRRVLVLGSISWPPLSSCTDFGW
jgi:hypothetical protein